MTDLLRRRLQHRLVTLFDQHRVVVWHDDSGALESLLRDGLPPGVDMPAFEGNPLSLRQAIDTEDPWLERKWLLYVPALPPGAVCEWLADYQQGFCAVPQGNLAWALREFFEAPETPELREALRGPAAKTLALRFGDYLPRAPAPLGPDDVSLALLGAAVSDPAASSGELVVRYLTSEADAGRWRELRYLPILTAQVKARLGLRRHLVDGQAPDPGALARCLVASALIEADAADARPLANHLPGEGFRPQWAAALAQGLRDPGRRAALMAAIEEGLRGSALLGELTDPVRLARGPALPVLDARLFELLLARRPASAEEARVWWDEIAAVARVRLGQPAADDEARKRWRWASAGAQLLRRLQARAAELMTYPADAGARLAADYVRGDGGDWEIDELYRALPQNDAALPLAWEQALVIPARHAYHRFCRDLVARFVHAVERAGTYAAAGFLRQRAFWSELVEPRGPVAVLLVDALRADLAHELRRMLEGRGHRVETRFVLAELPTRTEVGMAALLPRAQGAFAVRVEQGRLVPAIEDVRLPGTMDRRRYLETVLARQGRPVYRDELDAYLRQGGKLLADCRRREAVAVAHTTELDDEGGIAAGVSFPLFGETLAKCAAFVDYALSTGYPEVVVASDHGFLVRDPEAAPGGVPGVGGAGGSLARGLRYAAGVGDVGPHLVRLSATALGREGDDVYVPRDTSCVAVQGGAGLFVHGGLSPQECALVFLRVLPAAPAMIPTRLPVRLRVPERVTSLVFPVSLVVDSIATPLLVQPREVTLVAFDAQGTEAWRLETPRLLRPGDDAVTVMVTLPGGGEYSLFLRDADGDVPISTASVRVDVVGEAFSF